MVLKEKKKLQLAEEWVKKYQDVEILMSMFSDATWTDPF